MKLRVWFIIWLIVMIPFSSASALAQLRVQTISGADGARNFVRQQDTLTVEVVVKIDRDPLITPQQVRFDTFIFESCKAEGRGFFRCTYQQSLRDVVSRSEHTISLYNDNDRIVDSITEFISPDLLGPEITQIEITPPTTKTGEIVVSFTAEDYGIRPKDTSFCAGLSSAKVSEDDEAIETVALSTCTATEAIQHKSAIKQGVSQICVQATDRFENTGSKKCQTFFVDTNEPVISDFKIVKDGEELRFVKSLDPVRADVHVEIIDDNTDADQVTADFSGASTTEDSRRATEYHDTLFIWRDINIDKIEECSITIQAQDVVSNIVGETFNCGIILDENPPHVLSLESDYRDSEGTLLLGKEGELRVLFDETGVGMSRAQAFLDLRPLGGRSKVMANECTPSDNIWACAWDVSPRIKDGAYTISVSEETGDDLGNTLVEEYRQLIKVDTKVPRIVNIISDLDIITTEDSPTFILRVTGAEKAPRVFINASSISSESFPKSLSCRKEDTDFRCETTIRRIRDEPGEKTITFFLEDEAGNRFSVTHPMSIYTVDTKVTPNFFRVNNRRTVVTPSRLDRKVADIIAMKIVVQPKLEKIGGGADITFQEASCPSIREYLSADPYVINKGTSPHIILKTNDAIADLDELDISCSLLIGVRKGQTIYENPETEEITGKVKLYNNPLGDVGESIDDKLDLIDKDIKDIGKTIKRMEEVDEILSIIYEVVTGIVKIDAAIQIAESVLWLIALILYEIPFTKSGGENLWKITCEVATETHERVLKWIWKPGAIPGGQLTGLGDVTSAVIKLFTFIYSCEICDYNKILGQSVNLGAITENVVKIDGEGGLGEQLAVITFNWDPYKSIHTAQTCFCFPGIIYNLKKQKQVTCIYRNCIRDSATQGLPIDSCEQQYREQNCLYVESAAWKLTGGFGFVKLFAQMMMSLINEAVMLIVGQIWQEACTDGAATDTECRDDPSANGKKIVCDVWYAALALEEVDAFKDNKFPWETYTKDLEGEDFCGP